MSLRSLGLPIALASGLLLPAAPAAADDDDHRRGRGRHWDRDRHHDHDRHRGHRGHRRHHDRGHRYKHGHEHRHHGHWKGPRVVVKNHYHGRGHGHGGRYYAPAHVPYYCDPCSHYFDSYHALSHHVHHHHHIAALELPFVIFEARIGGGVGFVFGH